MNSAKNGKNSWCRSYYYNIQQPSFTFYYIIILFPSTVYQTLHLFWRGKQINVTVKVKYSTFRTICGFNFIPWKREIFFYMGSFSQKRNVTLEKMYNTYAITIYCKCARANKILSIVLLIDLTMNCYPMIYIYILPSEDNIRVLSIFIFFVSKPTSTFNSRNSLILLRTPTGVLYRFFFHYLCPSLFAGCPTSILSFHVYF